MNATHVVQVPEGVLSFTVGEVTNDNFRRTLVESILNISSNILSIHKPFTTITIHNSNNSSTNINTKIKTNNTKE
jgi:hypothetical protein